MNTTAIRRYALGLATVAVLGLAGGCGEDSTGTVGDSGTDAPDEVVCTVGGDFSGEVTAEASGGVAEDGAGEKFGPMRVNVRYLVSAGETSVVVVVTGPDDRELARVLYQVGTPLDEIEFQGGHGFTGLHYVTHEDAKLQFWCEAG